MDLVKSRRMRKLSSLEVTPSKAIALVVGAFPKTSRSIGDIQKDIRDWFPDASMAAPTARDLVRVAKSIPPREWSLEFDCDDFATAYLCKALKERIGGLTWCVGRAIFETTPAMETPHMMNVAIVDLKGNLALLVMEPQETGGGAAAHFLRKPGTGYELRRVVFG